MASLSELVQLAQSGDKEAENRLYEWLRPYVRKAVEILVQGGANRHIDASGITQEVLMQVLKSIPEYRGSRDPQFKKWIKTVLHNKCIDEIRKKTPTASLDESRPQGPLRGKIEGGVSSPSKRAIREEEANRIEQALENLPTDQREAVRMRHFEKLSISEITERLGDRSEEAVRQLIRRGMVRLKELLPDDS